MKKVYSLLLVAIMTVAMTTVAFALDFGSESEFVQNTVFKSWDSCVAGVDFTGLDKAVFYVTLNDLNWGWNNGQFYNWGSAEGSANNTQVTFGGTAGGDKDFGMTLDEVGSTFEIPLTIDFTNEFFQIGYGVYATTLDAFTLVKIELYAGEDLIGTWTDGVWEDAVTEPETTEPETDEPETDAPETDAPETDAPETDVPETDVPETDAPETDAPETDAPETDVPETDAPSTGVDSEETGDATPIMAVVIVLAVSALAMAAVSVKKIED